MAIRHLYRYGIILILGIAVCICGFAVISKPHVQPTPPQNITLHFGKQGVKELYEYQGGKGSIYPDIMSFNQIGWQPPNLGTVNVVHAGHTLKIDNAFSLLGARLGYKTDGIGSVDINAGLNKEEFVTSEQAYQAYVALMKQLNEQGWRQYFAPWEARYAKQENLKLLSSVSTNTASDSSHILNYNEWQKIFNDKAKPSSSIWIDMYLRDMILNLKIEKQTPPEDKPNTQQFMVMYQFESVKYTFFAGLNDKELQLDEQGLKKIYDEDFQRRIKSRNIDEEKAKQAGYHIDETYQDPDMWQYIIEPAY